MYQPRHKGRFVNLRKLSKSLNAVARMNKARARKRELDKNLINDDYENEVDDVMKQESQDEFQSSDNESSNVTNENNGEIPGAKRRKFQAKITTKRKYHLRGAASKNSSASEPLLTCRPIESLMTKNRLLIEENIRKQEEKALKIQMEINQQQRGEKKKLAQLQQVERNVKREKLENELKLQRLQDQEKIE